MRYILECWSPLKNKYERYREYSTIESAWIMFDKPYFRTRTRRLIRIQEDILFSEKAEKDESTKAYS